MGRRELPVDHTVPTRGALAAALRELRSAAGLSYDDLAVGTGVSATTLKRAGSGRCVPAWEIVTAITKVCHAHAELLVELSMMELKVLWREARIAERGRLQELRRPASPELITSPGALSEALVYFYEKAGGPPLRRLRELAGGAHLLPVSTAGRIVNRQALPVSRQQCVAFLTACGITPHFVQRWADAYDRVTATPRPLPGTQPWDMGAVMASRRDAVRLRERSAGLGAVRLADLHRGPGRAVRLGGEVALLDLLGEQGPREVRFVERPRRLRPRVA
ncbi:helix-turn-helix domain-containing protein [Streptomyces sp. NPDC058613]|uniref:helix-turn-helix domain-containing protein n=1 Tax=unclassified Streptomyces TaxID=2593676 RepID=UPI003663EAE1